MAKPSQITTLGKDGKKSGRVMLLVGPNGSGKTFQARTLIEGGMKVLFCSTERKLKTVEDLNPDTWPITHFDFPIDPHEKKAIKAVSKGFSMIDVFDYLRNEPHDYDALYIDSGMRYSFKLLELMFATTFNEKGGKDGRGAYGLYGRKMKLMFDILSSLSDASVASRPVHVIMTWGLEKGIEELTNRRLEMPIVEGKVVKPLVGYYFDDVLHMRKEMDGEQPIYVMMPEGTSVFDAKVSSVVKLPPKISPPNLYRLIKKLEGELNET